MVSFFLGLMLLSFLVLVHEFGHFVFAKILGVRVHVFSIGFGPSIFSFKLGRTKYQLAAIPLGGYVKMHGELLENEAKGPGGRFGFGAQSSWRKILIVLAGPIFNFILPVFLLFFCFAGTERVAEPIAGTVLPFKLAHVSGIKSGDRISKIDSESVKSFEHMISIISKKKGKTVDIEIKKDSSETKIDCCVVKLDTSNANKAKKTGLLGIKQEKRSPVIYLSNEKCLAYLAGLRTFDKITKINNTNVFSADDVARELKAQNSLFLQIFIRRAGESGELQFAIRKRDIVKAAGPEAGTEHLGLIGKTKDLEKNKSRAEKMAFIFKKNAMGIYGIDFVSSGVIFSVNKGSPAELIGIKPKDRVLLINGEPFDVWDNFFQEIFLTNTSEHVLVIQRGEDLITLAFQIDKNKLSAGICPREAFGVKIVNSYLPGSTVDLFNGPIDAIVFAVSQVWSMIALTFKSIGMLIGLNVPLSNLGGPVSVFSIAGQAGERGIMCYFYTMSLISVNLGVFNLLPVPVLDGGHALVFLLEAARGSPLSSKFKKRMMQLGLVFILFLMSMCVFNDISRLFN